MTLTIGVAAESPKSFMKQKQAEETASCPSFKLMNDTCECALKQTNKTTTK